MDDLKHIIKLLEDQGVKISKIERILELQQKNLEQVKIDKSVKTGKKNSSAVENNRKPPYQINNLYKHNFFKTEKKLGEVYKKLNEDGFHFKKGSIQYALDSADYLDRMGGKGNYRWAQKYPPS